MDAPLAAAPSELPESQELRRVKRQGIVVAGLFVTLAGIFLSAIALPLAPSSELRLLPIVGSGILLVWVGGIMMGRGSSRVIVQREPAPRRPR